MKILVYPYDKNPYQKLLYGSMRDEFKSRVKIRYMFFLPIFGALHVPLELLIRRFTGYRIIHIHWVAFFLRQYIPGHYVLSYYVTILNLWWLKFLRYKIIWTVHDITPHQKETSNDIKVSRILSKMSSLKIVHSTFAISQMKERGLDVDNIVVIPHGNYDGRYISRITRLEARALLNISESKIVFLFFGIIKDYKGVDDLLDAYIKVRTKNTILIIAGKCKDQHLSEVLAKARIEPDVCVFDEYVDDNDVAKYFMAADVVCLPFKSITSSGSVLLALTFGKPIIAPLEGSLKDLPRNIGILYSSENKDGLEQSMRMSLDSDVNLKSMNIASRKYADTLSWSVIAKSTFEAYKEVIRKDHHS